MLKGLGLTEINMLINDELILKDLYHAVLVLCEGVRCPHVLKCLVLSQNVISQMYIFLTTIKEDKIAKISPICMMSSACYQCLLLCCLQLRGDSKNNFFI